MNLSKEKVKRRKKIKQRVRKKVYGSHGRPRLSVFKSNRHIYAQIIDDTIGKTLVSFSSTTKSMLVFKGTKLEISNEVGKNLAQKAKSAGIEAVVFDRNGYLYHGRVKSLAEGAREIGLVF